MGRRTPAAPKGQSPASLKDPLKDRVVKGAPAPPGELLTAGAYWTRHGPNVKLLTEHLNLEGALSQELVMEIVTKTTEILEAEPNILKLSDPITVVGDIHGQYFDMCKILELGGDPAVQQYLFLGDFVDRGCFAIEVILLLFSYKILYPQTLMMLRGNHESRQMSGHFNFRAEAEYKYDTTVYDAIMECFDALPIAATVNGKFLCLHGGIAPTMNTLKSFEGFDRFMEPPREGVMCDAIWADPLPDEKDDTKKLYINNEVRGCSYFYSSEAAIKFLQKNKLLSVIRAHEAQKDGYKMHKTNKSNGFPTTITVFSAPNYNDVYGNKGAILKIDNGALNIMQYNWTSHPYYLPDFMDVFTWSLPFVMEKVVEILFSVLEGTGEEESADVPPLPEGIMASLPRASLSQQENNVIELVRRIGQASCVAGGAQDEKSRDRDRLRVKVKHFAKMASAFKNQRTDREKLLKLGGITPGAGIDVDELLAADVGGKGGMFNVAEKVDKKNEKRPEKEAPKSPTKKGRKKREEKSDKKDDKKGSGHSNKDEKKVKADSGAEGEHGEKKQERSDKKDDKKGKRTFE